VIKSRLAEAKNELKKIWDYKYALVNDVLDEAVEEMRAIVLLSVAKTMTLLRLLRVAGRILCQASYAWLLRNLVLMSKQGRISASDTN